MSLSVSCPECGTHLEVDDEYRTWKVRCPQCRHEFLPAAAVAKTEPMADEEDDERPRRRRRRRYERADPEAGAREIVTPAATLEWIGWISLALVLIVCAFVVAYGVSEAEKPRAANPKNGANEDPPEVFIFAGFCLGVIAIPYFVIIGIGARKLGHLSSRGWAMAAAIMAIAALPLFGVCGLPIFGPGIWALVVMNHDNVKAAFKQRQRRARRDDEDDDDEYD